ncbi:hypothetical protein ACF3DV_12100 [Chlorogloeopsis fritschii PCC 9212]|nr:hypothetical protein [Chlorogloeopsis fritschii]
MLNSEHLQATFHPLHTEDFQSNDQGYRMQTAFAYQPTILEFSGAATC